VIASIHQPNYIPWLGFFDKMLKSDIMILLDVVQFEKNEYQNRQKIKLSNGQPSWLTVPVHHKYPQAISAIEIECASNGGSWAKKHLHALRFNYEKAGKWKGYASDLEAIYRQHSNSLVMLNRRLIDWVAHELGAETRILLASELLGRDEDLNADPIQRILDLCSIVKADSYLTGKGALDYLCKERFAEVGIELVVQQFEHPVYPQLYGQFVSNLSVMDLLLNVGGQAARSVIVNPVEVVTGLSGAEL